MCHWYVPLSLIASSVADSWMIVDDPYSTEQLRSPRMNLSTIRPLVDRLYRLKDVSIGTLISIKIG